MQDVCVSFWPEGDTPGTSTFPDMIGKVTDICSTDPDDPTHCASPSDIKVDRAKVQVMYKIPSPGKENPDLQKHVFPKGTYWHLTKCVRRTLTPHHLSCPSITNSNFNRSGPTASPNPPTKTTGGANLDSPTTSCGASTPPASNGATTKNLTRAKAGRPTKTAWRSPVPKPLPPSHLPAIGPLDKNPSGCLLLEGRALGLQQGVTARRRRCGRGRVLCWLVVEVERLRGLGWRVMVQALRLSKAESRV